MRPVELPKWIKDLARRKQNTQSKGKNAPHATNSGECNKRVDNQIARRPSSEYTLQQENKRHTTDQHTQYWQAGNITEKQDKTPDRILPDRKPVF
jgi:hypothetical protein